MKAYLMPCSILFISLLQLSCSTVTPLTEDKPADPGRFSPFMPLGDLGQPVLLKAGMDWFGRHQSGLFLIKGIPEDTSVRIVFLSELGLSLLDMKYREGCFEVVSVREFMNKPALLKSLQDDFRTLLLDLSTVGTFTLESSTDECGPVESMRFRYGGERYTYRYREPVGTFLIQRKGKLFRKADLQIIRNDAMVIHIEHKGLRPDMELRQLGQPERDAGE
jgi:hypothetical protein